MQVAHGYAPGQPQHELHVGVAFAQAGQLSVCGVASSSCASVA